MKSMMFTVLLCLTVCAPVMAQDQVITIFDYVDGALSANAVPADQEVTFFVNIVNSEDTTFKGVTNGFRIYSPEGATWTATTIALLTSVDWASRFAFFFALSTNIDGTGADTVGFGGTGFDLGSGFPSNFDDTTYSLTVGPFDTAGSANQICIDSSYYPPSNVWKWEGGAGIGARTPSWEGPYCYFIVDPANPPTLVGAQPAGLTFRADGGEQPDTLTFTVLISDSSSISVDFSGTLTAKAGGDFTFSPTSGTHGTEVTVSIDGRGLSTGTHTGAITLTANDAANTTFEIPITLFIDMAVSVKPIEHEVLPSDFVLSQNYPNPFNPTTQIAFDLPTKSHVALTVYNVLGQRVITLVNEKLAAGKYVADWNGRSSGGNEVASGIYFYRLHTEQFTQTKKMVLLK